MIQNDLLQCSYNFKINFNFCEKLRRLSKLFKVVVEIDYLHYLPAAGQLCIYYLAGFIYLLCKLHCA